MLLFLSPVLALAYFGQPSDARLRPCSTAPITQSVPSDEDGSVLLTIDLSDKGCVLRADVESATSKTLGKQAKQLVKSWKFEPAKKDGKPVRVNMKLTITFQKGSALRTSSQLR